MLGAIPPLPQYAFMAWCLVKAQEQLTFTRIYASYDKHYSTLLLYVIQVCFAYLKTMSSKVNYVLSYILHHLIYSSTLSRT